MVKNIVCLVLMLVDLLVLGAGSVLSLIDTINYVSNTYSYMPSGPVGLSYELTEVIEQVSNPVHIGLIQNSCAYGDYSYCFSLALHNQGSAKYNCTLCDKYANRTLNCSYDLSNKTLLEALGNFISKSTYSYALEIGWDNEGADYSKTQYMKKVFQSFYKAFRPRVGF
jgi:hypothetical protein